MTVQASISISYVADSQQDVNDLLASLALPVGANVTASVREVVATGTIDDNGQIVDPSPTLP